MTISDMYDINRIILNVEQALCIDGSDYGEKDVDVIIENVTNRIITKYQLDLHNRKITDDIKTLVKGLMIESYIEEGSQKIGEHVYGKSITDPCLGWEDSKKLIYDIAEMNS